MCSISAAPVREDKWTCSRLHVVIGIKGQASASLLLQVIPERPWEASGMGERYWGRRLMLEAFHVLPLPGPTGTLYPWLFLGRPHILNM